MRPTINRPGLVVGWLPGGAAGCSIAGLARADGPESPEASAFFEASVRPVLVEQCWKCHGPEKQSGGLRLDSRASILEGGDAGPAVVPGEPDKSPMVLAVRHQGDLKMPPKAASCPTRPSSRWRGGSRWGPPGPSGPVPSAEAKADAARKHWSFQPVRDPAPPRGRGFAVGRLAGRRLHPGQARGEEARPLAPGRQADPDPPGHLRPDRPAPDARGGRRLPRRRGARAPSPGSSTACSPRPGTASGGAGTGSTSPATPTPRGTSSPPSDAIPTRTPIATT